MEPPVTFDARAVRDEKSKVMQAIRPFDPAKIDEVALRAQYGPGFDQRPPGPGLHAEKGVKPQSTTETYAALRMEIDNWRWAGVPFYVQTGKRLAKRVSEIVIRFRRTPHMIFRRGTVPVNPNLLVIRIQPDEGISPHRGSEGAGTGAEAEPGDARLQVPRSVRQRAAGGLRAPAPRRHQRRRHPLLPRRLDQNKPGA